MATATAEQVEVKLGQIVDVSITPRQPCRVTSIHDDGTITVVPIGQPLDACPDDDGDGCWMAV